MSSTYNDSFTSSLHIWISFISFPCLIALAKTATTTLNRSGGNGILVLFQNIAGRLLVFQCWVLFWLWVCHKWLLLCWDIFSQYPLWWQFLSWMDTEFYQMLFLYLLRWSSGFCLFLMQCTTFIDLHMFSHPCDLKWIEFDHGV